MRNLSDTIARLKSAQGTAYAGAPAQPSRLSDLGGFGAEHTRSVSVEFRLSGNVSWVG